MIIRTVAVAAVLAAASPAYAQDFSGSCTDYRSQGKEACVSTGWCRWAQPKARKLPNGQTFTPTGYCAFKPGFKAGYQATVTNAATEQ